MALRPADQIARVHTAVDITVLGALQFTTVQTVTTVLSDSPEQLIRLAWPATATPLRCSVRLEEYTGETNEAAGDPNSLFSSWAWSSPAALRASAAGQPLLLGAIPFGTNIVIEADFVTHIPTDGPARGAVTLEREIFAWIDNHSAHWTPNVLGHPTLQMTVRLPHTDATVLHTRWQVTEVEGSTNHLVYTRRSWPRNIVAASPAKPLFVLNTIDAPAKLPAPWHILAERAGALSQELSAS